MASGQSVARRNYLIVSLLLIALLSAGAIAITANTPPPSPSYTAPSIPTTGVLHGVHVGVQSTLTLPEPVSSVFARLRTTPKKIALFITRLQGKFYDNLKYAFLECQRNPSPQLECVFVFPTLMPSDPDYTLLVDAGIDNVVSIGALNDFEILSKVVAWVGDSYDFIKQLAMEEDGNDAVQRKSWLWAIAGVPWVNMFHCPIVIKNLGHYSRAVSAASELLVRPMYSGVHTMVTTGPLSTVSYQRAFHASWFAEIGHPRLDVLLRTPDKFDLLNVDAVAFQRVYAARVEGKRVVAYLPTARYLTVDEKDELAFTAGVLDPNALSRFAVENNMVIVIHLHYTMAADEMMAHVSSLPGFIVVAANTDLQPMLFMFDVVVTDYSTVYLDFLFFARPIVFFAWDREQYMQREGLLFNYDDITPGAVVATQDALFQALRESVSRNADDDPYAMLRVKLRDRVFVYTDGGSAARLLRYLERRFVNATHDELWHIPIDATDSVRRA